MADFLNARDKVLDGLRREMVGPDPCGIGIDLSKDIDLDNEAAYGAFFELATGQEILRSSRPTSRYGVGVLYPTGLAIDATTPQADDEELDVIDRDPLDSIDEFAVPVIDEFTPSETTVHEFGDEGVSVDSGDADDDLDLTSANQLRPSAMGISFLLDLN